MLEGVVIRNTVQHLLVTDVLYNRSKSPAENLTSKPVTNLASSNYFTFMICIILKFIFLTAIYAYIDKTPPECIQFFDSFAKNPWFLVSTKRAS